MNTNTFQPADNISVILFSIFSVLMAAIIFKVLLKTIDRKKWLGLFTGIVILFAVAGLSGLVAKNFVPFGPMLFAILFVLGITFAFSRAGLEVATLFSFAALIGFQCFRLPLELILHHWAMIGTIPETMTWTGQNWDIVSGIIGVVAIFIANKNRKLAMILNAIGFVLLLNVIRVVVLSAPLPFAWSLEKPLLLVAYFPYSLIGPLFVLPALVGHLLVFRKLRSGSTK